MRHQVVLAPAAVSEYRKLRAYDRAQVRDAIEQHLRFEPTRTSKSGIKRLRGLAKSQYRLRVGEVRIFYDVTETSVEILAIVSKNQAQAWLEEKGVKDA
jgi:mRNA-degrading endonuclease RelE of RelBE toxin-antitoxin system